MVEPSRDRLGELLGQLGQQPKDHDTRLEAARTALVLCFRKGDPHFADVAESLVVDAPRLTPRTKRAELDKLAAQATAIRRAVAMAHGLSHGAPSSLAETLIADPDQLAREVEQRIESDQPALAQAVLEVGLTRHRGDPRLEELQRRHQERWPYGVPSRKAAPEE